MVFFQVKKLFYQLHIKIGHLNGWFLEKIISHTGYIVESSSKYDNLVHNSSKYDNFVLNSSKYDNLVHNKIIKCTKSNRI